MLALRTLEFHRIVERVRALALTPMGSSALAALAPSIDPKVVVPAQRATTETVTFLERQPLFALRAGEVFAEALASLTVLGRPLEPLQLRAVADFVDSADHTRINIVKAGAAFEILGGISSRIASFKDEAASVRR